MQMFSNQTANGSSVAQTWRGGRGSFAGWGTFGGAKLALEWSGDEGLTWIEVGAASTYYANGLALFDLPTGKVRSTISGATGATSLSARI